jgi:NAD(P)-dependent dehydrogenase (short-subunit alcohol dehydrogenase family)
MSRTPPGLPRTATTSRRPTLAPLGRIAVPNDASTVVAFVLSPDAALATGQNICVDGGATLARAAGEHGVRRFGMNRRTEK